MPDNILPEPPTRPMITPEPPIFDTRARLAAVIERLTPVGQMGRGSPLRSDDWNHIVAGVIDLARVALAQAEGANPALDLRYAAKGHTHVGEADMSWFDPSTRTLLEERLLGASDLRADVKGLQDQLTAVQRDLGQARADMRALLLRIDHLDDRDRLRELAVNRADARIDGMRQMQTDMAKVQTNLNQIGVRVDDALAFRRQLVDDTGAPLNLAALVGRVKTVEAMADGLKGPDGVPVRFHDFDARVGTLETKAITTDNLDATINDRMRAGNLIDTSAIADTVTTRVRADSAAVLTDINNKLTVANTAVADLTTRQQADAQALGTLGTRMAAAEVQVGRISTIAGQLDGIGGRVAAVEGTTQLLTANIAPLSGLTTRVSAIETRLPTIDLLTTQVGALNDGLVGVRTQIARIDALDVRLNVVEQLPQLVNGAVTRIGALETNLAVTRRDLTNVSGQVTVLQSSNNDFTSRLGKLERGDRLVRPGFNPQ